MKPEKIEETITKALAKDGMVTLATVLNLNDPDQERLFRHAAQRSNFSAYIKRLMQRDMDGVTVQTVGGHTEILDEIDDEIDPNLMNSLI